MIKHPYELRRTLAAEVDPEPPILWHRVAVFAVATIALPFSITMLVCYVLPEVTGWVVIASILVLIVGWGAGGAAASDSRPRSWVIAPRLTITEQRYRFETLVGGWGIMLIMATIGFSALVGAAVGWTLSTTM